MLGLSFIINLVEKLPFFLIFAALIFADLPNRENKGQAQIKAFTVVHSFFIYREHVLKKKTLTFSNFYSEFNCLWFFIEFLQKPNESLFSKLPKTPRKSEKCWLLPPIFYGRNREHFTLLRKKVFSIKKMSVGIYNLFQYCSAWLVLLCT